MLCADRQYLCSTQFPNVEGLLFIEVMEYMCVSEVARKEVEHAETPVIEHLNLMELGSKIQIVMHPRRQDLTRKRLAPSREDPDGEWNGKLVVEAQHVGRHGSHRLWIRPSHRHGHWYTDNLEN